MPFFMSPLKPGCIFEVDAIMEVTIQRRARRCCRGGQRCRFLARMDFLRSILAPALGNPGGVQISSVIGSAAGYARVLP